MPNPLGDDARLRAGELRYEATTGGNALVSGDVTGDGTADFSIVISHITSMQAGDFIL